MSVCTSFNIPNELAVQLVTSNLCRVSYDPFYKFLQLSFYQGYATDKFSWNISGNLKGENPTVLSELKWQKLDGYRTIVNLHAELSSAIGLQHSLSDTYYMYGCSSDTDFAEDNRQCITFKEELNASKSISLDTKILLT